MKFQTKIQLLGHATFKVTTPEGRIVIIDPWLIDNPFIPEKDKVQDKIDLMLVTHGHDDHFDVKLPEILAKTQAKLVANPICRWYLLENGLPETQIEPINYGGTIELLDVKVTMVQAFHLAHINEPDGRFTHPHGSVGFILHLSDGLRIYFAGDTGVFGDMKLIGDIYKPQVAVLPIGDRYTMGPLEAFYAVGMIGAQYVIPFHYGTFDSLVGKPEDLIERVRDLDGVEVCVLKAGEVWER
jgi:L-ascorbate metabolism protein UlaG (beta-lactamase superfamily)